MTFWFNMKCDIPGNISDAHTTGSLRVACKVEYLKVVDFPYLIMENSWNLKVHELCRSEDTVKMFVLRWNSPV